MAIPEAILSSKKSDWQTPDELIDAVHNAYGQIDFDPCTEADNPTRALCWFTAEDDAFTRDGPWAGLTYMNPPWGKGVRPGLLQWVNLFFERAEKGILLLKADTSTKAAQEAIRNSIAVLFLSGRLRFEGAEQAAPFPVMLCFHGLDPRQLSNLGTILWRNRW